MAAIMEATSGMVMVVGTVMAAGMAGGTTMATMAAVGTTATIITVITMMAEHGFRSQRLQQGLS